MSQEIHPEESKEQETGSYSPSLYDEDTFDETSKDKKKKVLIPVLICGIIAVIGLVALLVFLFVIKPKNSASSQEVPPYTIETTKPANDEAREDEIIIVETPIVEPVNSVAKSSAKGDVIDYKIKWGDTLWDISKTYYKTPWQYQFLADYNNISNPDFILAGAHLDIPPR